MHESIVLENDFLRSFHYSAWQFYGVDMSAVSSIRASFLLRVLVVDVQPFQTLIMDLLENEDWEVR